MSFDNVNLFFAKDENGEIVIINDVAKGVNKRYTCPICGSEVKARLGAINSWHFYHIDKSKCSNESRVHWWIKNKLMEKGTEFTIKTDKEIEYICKDILVEKSYEINGKVYQPDLTILTECGKTIFFEMEYSNKKKPEDYMSMWIDLNNIVVEVNTKDLIRLGGLELPIFKALFYDGKCKEVKKSNEYHNTIGKYKEQLRQNGEYEKRKEGLKKLDWLWRDVIEYKQGNLSIEYLVDLIDNIENKERGIVKEVLLKPKCVNLLDEYIYFKEKYVIELIKDSYNRNEVLSNDCFNIKSNMHSWKSICCSTIQLCYENRDYSISSYVTINLFEFRLETIAKINNFILKIKELINIRTLFKPICEQIKDAFQCHKGIFVDIQKGDRGSNHKYYIYTIQIVGFEDNEKLEFKIGINSIEYFKYKRWNGNNIMKEELEYDTLNLDNNYIFKFVNEIVNEEIAKNDILVKYRLKEKRRQILLGIEENNRKTNNVMNKILDIFKNSNEKILSYELSNFTDSDYKNGIYFKDYRNKEFIIYDSSQNNSSFRSTREDILIFDKYKNNLNMNFIDLRYISEDCKIYFIETFNSYTIDYTATFKYDIKNELKNAKIKLSFKNIDNTYTPLLRYDFINATKQLNEIRKEISEYMKKYKENFDHSKIQKYELLFNDDINNKINRVLYPIVYANNKNNNTDLNTQLNINFTKTLNKLEPWLIKDFIEVLERLGIKNVKNII